jgi:hypothetical protein
VSSLGHALLVQVSPLPGLVGPPAIARHHWLSEASRTLAQHLLVFFVLDEPLLRLELLSL